MNITHIALGGCLRAPPVSYGVTEDTGGHIAYVLESAQAQSLLPHVAQVTIVTRFFEDDDLDAQHAMPLERLSDKLSIRRLATSDRRYLQKAALRADLDAFIAVFLDDLQVLPRRPDVLHAHFSDAVRVAAAARDRFGIPFFYTPHALGIDKLSLGWEQSLEARIAEERWALGQADGIIVSSHDEAERQVAAYEVADVAGRVHLVAPGLPSNVAKSPVRAKQLLREWLDDPTKPLLLAVARPVRKKNLVALARAYASTPELRERANLVILAGQRGNALGSEERDVLGGLQRHLGHADVAGRVALPDRHTSADVSALYRLAATTGGLFVNAALHEPFGLTLLEAAAAGLPVVATRNGGPADIIAAIGHGVLVDPSDDVAIAQACLDVLRDPALHERLSRSAVRNRTAFSWPRYAERSVELYQAALASPRSSMAAGRQTLLVCDLDGTLTGCPLAAARFRTWAAERKTGFVIATGRSLSDARCVLAHWRLPEPDAFITAVGTTIYRRDDRGRFVEWQAFTNALEAGWDRETVAAIADRLGLAVQPLANQRRHKLSFFGTAQDAALIEAALAMAGVAARVVFSHGRFIDLLAPGGGKAAAIEAYAQDLGLSLDDCVAAGDSGNDADMLARCAIGIVVGNASSELDGLAPRPGLIRTTANHAAGVLEGLSIAGLNAPWRAVAA